MSALTVAVMIGIAFFAPMVLCALVMWIAGPVDEQERFFGRQP